MIGAVARASVVIIPGIHAASAMEVPTSNVIMILKEKKLHDFHDTSMMKFILLEV